MGFVCVLFKFEGEETTVSSLFPPFTGSFPETVLTTQPLCANLMCSHLNQLLHTVCFSRPSHTHTNTAQEPPPRSILEIQFHNNIMLIQIQATFRDSGQCLAHSRTKEDLIHLSLLGSTVMHVEGSDAQLFCLQSTP